MNDHQLRMKNKKKDKKHKSQSLDLHHFRDSTIPDNVECTLLSN